MMGLLQAARPGRCRGGNWWETTRLKRSERSILNMDQMVQPKVNLTGVVWMPSYAKSFRILITLGAASLLMKKAKRSLGNSDLESDDRAVVHVAIDAGRLVLVGPRIRTRSCLYMSR
mmetsp:Transcript_30176/g.44588  ORF Transcript_30176/g.44588 Transcript_30176/m.44588 type:complete len:117 (-) Transcript_30176:169-519(-)